MFIGFTVQGGCEGWLQRGGIFRPVSQGISPESCWCTNELARGKTGYDHALGRLCFSRYFSSIGQIEAATAHILLGHVFWIPGYLFFSTPFDTGRDMMHHLFPPIVCTARDERFLCFLSLLSDRVRWGCHPGPTGIAEIVALLSSSNGTRVETNTKNGHRTLVLPPHFAENAPHLLQRSSDVEATVCDPEITQHVI